MKNIKRPPTEILNIPANCDTKTARRSYKKLVREYSPEHHPDDFEKINNAYRAFTGEQPISNQNYPIYESPLTILEQSIKKKEKQDNTEHLIPLSVIPASIFNVEFELEKIIE